MTKAIGQGEFSDVYLAVDKEKEREIVVKVETKGEYLLKEAKLMNLLRKGVGTSQYSGFPELIWFGEEHGARVIIMECLGPSLEDMFNFCGKKFSLKSVIMIAD
mgnify:CR=1 FL=1